MKILIIEDSPDLRGPLAKALVMQGYQVLVAENGRRGLEICREQPEVALVLLDWTLPEMCGDVVYEELRRMRGDIKVIIMCGTVLDGEALAFARRNVSAFLHKPFSLTALFDAIRLALASVEA